MDQLENVAHVSCSSEEPVWPSGTIWQSLEMRKVKIHYIGVWIPKRTLKKSGFWELGEKYSFDRKTNATSVFISSMVMIFIFGFAKNYLLEKKLQRFYDKIWAIFDPWLQTFPM